MRPCPSSLLTPAAQDQPPLAAAAETLACPARPDQPPRAEAHTAPERPIRLPVIRAVPALTLIALQVLALEDSLFDILTDSMGSGSHRPAPK